MTHDRRSVLTALGLAIPFGLAARAGSPPPAAAPALRLRPFEEAVRAAFAAAGRDPSGGDAGPDGGPCRRIEVGHSDEVRAGLQGCVNDRPFAGFPAGHLRVVRAGTGPGPVVGGVRLYVATVDVVLTGGRAGGGPGRPFDFASLPPAPALCDGAEASADGGERPPPRG